MRTFAEAALTLGRPELRAHLLAMAERAERRQYMLPVVGAFSAGKSSLINRLLDRDLLPTRRVETTAMLTYISYGEAQAEGAILEYADGSRISLTLTEVKQLDNVTLDKLKPVAALRITLHNPLLAAGLVLVDTPGVDTTIAAHEQMTQRLLEESEMVIYVSQKPLAETDARMIRRIIDAGLGLSVVRTHADNINISEERRQLAEVFADERRLAEQAVGRSTEYFAVSNLPAPQANEALEAEMADLRRFLTQTVGAGISETFEEAGMRRLEKARVLLLDDVEMRLQATRAAATGSLEQVSRQIASLEKTRHALKQAIDRRAEAMAREKSTQADALSAELAKEARTLTDNFRGEIAACTDPLTPESAANLLTDSLAVSFSYLNAQASDALAGWAQRQAQALNADLSEISLTLTPGKPALQFSFSLEDAQATAQRCEQLQCRQLEALQALSDLQARGEEELKALGLQREEVNRALQECEQVATAAIQGEQELKSSYVPQYVDVPSSAAGILSKIGTCADLALLVIPGKAFAKGAQSVGKFAKSLEGAGKLGQVARHAAIGAGKTMKFLSKTDRVKDIFTLSKMGVDVLHGEGARREMKNRGNSKKTTIFDYLSLSHWFGKVGEWIDPPTQELDKEYDAEYRNRLAQIRAEGERATRQKILELERLRLIDDRQQRNAKEQELRMRQTRREAEEIARLHAELQKKKEGEIQRGLRRQVCEKHCSALRQYAAKLEKEIMDKTDGATRILLETANAESVGRLNAIEEQLQAVLRDRNENHDGDCGAQTAGERLGARPAFRRDRGRRAEPLRR